MPLESPDLTKMTTTSSVLASYDWRDLVTGNGFIDFFPNVTLGLPTTFFPSDKMTSSGNLTLSASTRDFDSGEFSEARVFKGTAYFTIFSSGVSGGNFIRGRLYIVRGGVETAISDQVSTSMSTIAANLTIAIPITERTTIQAGDILRFEFVNTTSVTFTFGSSSPKLSVPVEVDA